MALAAWVARLGFLADLLSRPVLVGYLTGVSLIMIAGQLGPATGVPVTGEGFLAEVRSFAGHLEDARLAPSLITLAVLIFNAALIWLAGSLVRSRQEAMQASQAKSRFLSNMSHEFRTPLNGVLGYYDALREELGESPLAQYATAIHDSGNRLLELVESILEVTALEDRRVAVHREPENIRELVSQAIGRHYQAAQSKGLQLECRISDDVPQIIVCDIGLIERVLENLLGNAWKFTSRVASPRIEFGTTLVDGERAYFVRDNGAGFDMYYANKLFNAFNRLHGDKDFRGSGIGLATVARIIHRHHGKLSGEGIVDHGATFWFTLG